MDQTKNGLGSGIGNYLANEILYRAKMSPHTSLKDLVSNKSRCYQLSQAIKYTFKLSYLTNISGYMEHLENFLDTHKKLIKSGELPIYHKTTKINKKDLKTGFTYQVYQQKTDPLGNPVIKENIISNRTAYWVKEIQV